MSAIDSSNMVTEILLDVESQLTILMGPGITTITFFNGEKPDLKERVFDIVQKNPWLVGTLFKNRKIHKKNVLFRYPLKLTTDEQINQVYFDASLPISDDMSFHELTNVLTKDGILACGSSLIKKKLPVSKFTITSCTNGGFALILSISHSVADGHTYYKILSMISRTIDIEVLSPTRKHEMTQKGIDAIGSAEYKYLTGVGLTINVVGKMLQGQKSNISAFFVDKEKVKEIKSKEDDRLRMNKVKNTSSFSCSTNDILTSTYGHLTKSRIMMMPINWRERLDGSIDSDAGNYESAIPYDPLGYEYPSDIRESLSIGPPFNRQNAQPLPKCCEALSCSLSMITSWAFNSFDSDMVLSDQCKQTLHMPIFIASGLPFPVAVVFKPIKDKLAIMFAGPKKVLTEDKIKLSSIPIGESVNLKIFNN